ncbi:hypothetical protein [Shimia sp. Alg240-R146]|uniref:hypothetical protein n=1 Tax=Shimia sp. Alg240-R146 TaxID=2993449 RepID=UPI0022E54F1F|nr:hypothetical protein [Shimia sp. Alg240-R146]
MKFPKVSWGRTGNLNVAIFAVALVGCAWASTTDAAEPKRSNVIVISHDRGGDVVKYAQRVSRVKHANSRVKFQGKCQSACTLFLGLPAEQTCIARGASFSFHRAYGASQEMNAWGTDYMLKSYPAWVAHWIARNGGLGKNLIHMKYEYASQYLPTCSQREVLKPRLLAAVSPKGDIPKR